MRKLFLLLWILMLYATEGEAQQVSRFQALYIFNFAKNTEWPTEDNGKHLVITVVGDKAVAKDLRTIAQNKMVGSRSVVINEAASAQGISEADMVFLGEAKDNQIETLVSEQAKNKTMIISATEGHCDRGACIAFEVVKGKFSYAIHTSAIASHGLTVTKILINNGRAL